MIKKTVIIDYGMGNVASVQKALNFLQAPNSISNLKEEIEQAHYLVLPGVGSFKQGMENLSAFGLIDVLNNEVLNCKKPILGICLGMQLFAEKGTEPEACKGLGWVKGEVLKIQSQKLKIPHLGWNNTKFMSNDYSNFDNKDFYFIHSYHFNVTDKNKILATVNYGNDYVAAIHHQNLMATQFHPEKSKDIGLSFLKHFFCHYA